MPGGRALSALQPVNHDCDLLKLHELWHSGVKETGLLLCGKPGWQQSNMLGGHTGGHSQLNRA